MPKTSIICKLTLEEIKNDKININEKDIGKFFPELDKNINIIYGMTQIQGKLKIENLKDKKKSKKIFYIKLSQNINFKVDDKIKIIKLNSENFEIQKIK
ncbi:MAG: hypothetical protein EAX96_16420 [Candidatus Lokiarchaeota archaeon]|nr:hypothetical protein [Candidatus Lokiarchaeota archaeon]